MTTAVEDSTATPADGLRRSRRMLATVVTVALGSAAIGWWAGQTIESPDEAARRAQPPPAAPITVPVERRVLESAVVTRGDVRFAEAVALEIPAGTGDGSAATVVTGRVPSAGDEIREGDVVLEVSGRPVIALAGALPMYRTLRPGLSGEDVRQLTAALIRLGFLSGDERSTYDAGVEAAVRRLYQAVGYLAARPSAEQEQHLAAAQMAVDSARAAHRQAEQALAAASQPPPRSAVLAAEGEVEQARLALERLTVTCAAVSCEEDPTQADLRAQLAAAANRLAVAEASLAELTAPPDTSALRQEVADARAALTAAERTLADLRATTGVPVPYGEVVFVPSLPRRVDSVNVSLGDVPSGPVLSLTGADIQVVATVGRAEAALLTVGQPVRLDDQLSGVELVGAVSAVADVPGTHGVGPGQFAVVIAVSGGDPAELAGLNLRVTIPIQSTGGDVLTVPLAALVTDATGTTVVQVARGDRFATVVVAVGLAAGGLVEVRPVDGELLPGDLVVVGQQR